MPHTYLKQNRPSNERLLMLMACQSGAFVLSWRKAVRLLSHKLLNKSKLNTGAKPEARLLDVLFLAG